MPQRNPFAVLGLPLDATAETIKRAWRGLARQHHPDVTSGDPALERRANRRMAEINAAYQELRDPEKRRSHREAAARAARAAGSRDGFGYADRANGEPAYNPPPGWVPRPRPVRPVTARIDTTELFHPRNTTLHPLDHSPLPGLPPRPREAFMREGPRASDPTSAAARRQGTPYRLDTIDLDDALETRLRFGKFEGWTLAEVATREPTYIDWIVRTIGRDAELMAAARVVQRYLDQSGAGRRRRFGEEPRPQAR